jgi:CheY-like chemotaxis protein
LLPPSVISKEDSVNQPVFTHPIQHEKWTGENILIVEDEQANFMYVKRMLGNLDLKIHWAANGKDAVALISEGMNFHVILMDIKMPVMDGFEATKAIKSQYPSQIVIALTAYARPEDRVRFQEAGFNDYLTKPIKPQEFLRVIQRYLNQPMKK